MKLLLWIALLVGCGSEQPREQDPRPNILLISLDTLRADRLSAYGYERDTSPFLQELAGQGKRFNHAFVNTHGTPPSHATLFTSAYQQTHRVSIDVLSRDPDHRLPEDLSLLPEVMRDAGYVTIGVTGGGYMSEAFGFDRGFDVFNDDPVNVERGARRLLREIRRQSDKGKPIFAFFHTYEVHSPYDPPGSYQGRYGTFDSSFEPTSKNLNRFRRKANELRPEDLEHISALYDAGIRYTDDTLRDLFGELERSGFLDHHLSVVTSDHGEEFGEHQGLLHPATLFDEVLRVPLILFGTNVEPGVEDRLVSTVDIAPTLYQRSGVQEPVGLEGRDLLTSPIAASEQVGVSDEEVVFAQYGDMLYGIRSSDFKLIENRKSKQILLYDLKMDPGEQKDVSHEHPHRVERMRQRLAAWLQRVDGQRLGFSQDTPAEIDPEQRRQLEALGYLN